MEKTKVTIMDKGPIIVDGNIDLIHQLGGTEEKTGKIALCRCGYSENKPYCDGAHKNCPVKNTL